MDPINPAQPITPSDASRVQVRTDALRPDPTNTPAVLAEDTTAHWADVAAATWRRETVVSQFALAMGVQEGIQGDTTFQAGWNPFSFYNRNRADYEDLDQWVTRGEFDNVMSETAFKRKAEIIRRNQTDLETMERGGWGGALAGIGASMLDVTSLVSVGSLWKLRSASRLVNAGRGAAVVAADAAVQEAALQGMDPTRTAEESFMAIGTGAFLGAGLGSLFKHLPPDSKLRPEHPENPLHPQNLGKAEEIIEHRIGQTLDEGVRIGGRDSIGAMRAVDDANEFAQGSGVGGFLQGLSEKVLAHGTPVARLRHYDGPGRDYLVRLVDLGGRLTKAMARGDAPAPEAESLRTVYIQKARDTQEDLASIYREANMDMGQSALGTAAKSQLSTYSLGNVDANAVPRQMFFEAVQKRMSANMLEGNGFSGRRFAVQKEVTEDLKKRGFTEEQANKVWSRVEQAAERSKRLLDDMKGDAIKSGLMDEKLDLGDGYGLPVQYVRAEINRDPRAFENLLLRLLADQPDEEWIKASGIAMKGEGEARVPMTWDEIQQDTKLANDVLKAWRGDTEQAMLDQAVSNFEAAQAKLKTAMDEFEIIEDGLAFTEKQKKARTVASMKARVQAAEAGYHARSMSYALARVEKADARIAELREKYPDLEDFADDAQRQFAETGEDIDTVVAGFPVKLQARNEAKALVSELAGQRRQARKDGMLYDELAAQMRTEMLEAIEARKAANAELREARRVLGEAAKRQRNALRWVEAVAQRIDQNRQDLDLSTHGPGIKAQLDAEADRLELLRTRAHEAEQVRQRMVQDWKEVRKGLNISRREVRELRKEVRKTGRALSRLQKGSPLVKYVDEVTTALRGQDRFPGGLLMDQVAETGRLKERRFKWTPELWNELVKRGFVETDAPALLDRYARDMGGRLAIQKSIGHQNVEEVLREVRDHYDDLLTKATDPKQRKQIERLRDVNLKDVRASWDRILGKHEITEDTAVSWLASKLGTMGFLRFAGGFIFSAVGDLATAMFAAPGFVRGFRKAHKAYADILKRAAVGDPDAAELKMILASFESGAHMATSIRALGGGTARDHIGFGSGMTKELSGKVDKVMNLAADRANVLSGLAALSDSVRRTAGLVQLKNIQRWSVGYEKATDAQRADMASLGIGRAEAKRLAELFKKHGTDHGPLFDPGMSKWLTEPDGDAMADVLNSALVKAQQRASYTQGFGHMPLMMDHWYGKLFFQFQTYAFQYTNNFVLAGIQRGAVSGDFLRFAHVLGTAMAAAMVVSSGRAYLRGEDPTEWDNAKWANEIVTRSGLLGWTQPYADSAVKLFGPGVNEVLGANVLSPSSKFQQNGWLESLLGPWAGTLNLVSETTAGGARGEWTAAGEKALRLVPLNQQINALRVIADSMEE